MPQHEDRDWFAEDIAPLLPPTTDIPIEYRLTARAYAETVSARPRSPQRCASAMPYRGIRGGQSW